MDGHTDGKCENSLLRKTQFAEGIISADGRFISSNLVQNETYYFYLFFFFKKRKKSQHSTTETGDVFFLILSLFQIVEIYSVDMM